MENSPYPHLIPKKTTKLPALKTGYMIEEYEKKKRKRASSMRSIMDYGIGIFILVVGFFFFFRNKFPISFNQDYPPNEVDKLFGAICVLYGGWRIYRGYKKNYFR